MAAELSDGHGLVFAWGDGASTEAFTAYAKVMSAAFAGRSASIIPVRTHDVNYIQKLVDVIDNGQVTLTLAFDSADTAHNAIKTTFEAKTKKNYKVTAPDVGALAITFGAYITGWRLVSEIGSVVTLEVTFEITESWSEA